MRTLLAVTTAVLACAVHAQTVYTWEDKDGVHYTDDRSQIPRGVKAREETMEAPPPSTSTVAAPVPPTEARKTPAPGGLTERAWRDRFVTATRRIDTLQKTIESMRATMPSQTTCTLVNVPVANPGGQPVLINGQPVTQVSTLPVQQCGRSFAYEQAQRDLARKEIELQNAELDLQQLDRDASYAGVPREWRRGW